MIGYVLPLDRSLEVFRLPRANLPERFCNDAGRQCRDTCGRWFCTVAKPHGGAWHVAHSLTEDGKVVAVARWSTPS